MSGLKSAQLCRELWAVMIFKGGAVRRCATRVRIQVRIREEEQSEGTMSVPHVNNELNWVFILWRRGLHRKP